MTSDFQIMCSLMHQVARAAQGDTEQSVVTYITRPLWRRWNRAVGMPEDSWPTDWIDAKGTNRIYGSKTIVIEGVEELFAISYKPA